MVFAVVDGAGRLLDNRLWAEAMETLDVAEDVVEEAGAVWGLSAPLTTELRRDL